MLRRTLVICLTVFVASSSRAAELRPNVVLIVADDLGGSDLGCYGSRFHRTPHIDRLAAEGRRFTQSYAACPVCSPTRAALMTGKNPARLHLTDWLPGRPDQSSQKLLRPKFRQELPLEEVTLAEALKAGGYATGSIGKWHLGGAGFEPEKQGFDFNVGGNAAGSPLSYFAPFARGGRTMPGLGDAPAGQYLTDRLTDEAVHFIEAHRTEPFFLYLPHFAVHTPLSAKRELEAKYPPWDGTPRGRQENPTYAAMIESVDESVGRIVKTLEQVGLTDRTIVLFTSDNGGLATREGPRTPATINAPFREGKGWLYEGGVRVPLIVRWPGHVKPGSEATPVSSVDVRPTVQALCGLGQPSDADGTNLAALLTEGQLVAPRALYWHYPHYSNQGGRPGGAIRDGDWKLVEFYENQRRELFNLVKDPSENVNLAAKEPAKTAALTAKLHAWRKVVDAQMTRPNPDYAPNRAATDGTITLPAATAEVHGVMLRFEPLPHKNTLGYWVNADDWASWEFDVREPTEYTVEALVGCGTGSGGSNVEFRFAGRTLTLQVPETGGFQAFRPQSLGLVAFDRPGRFELEVHAVSKPGPAVMDLRQVKLVPVRKPDAAPR